jgi:UDP-GlcNAc:undecaprenyl-phosphate GlcNAc-1-phosphate transferase
LSLLLTFLVRNFSVKYQLLDYPNHRKIHLNPTPTLGGISIFLSFNLVFLVALIWEGKILSTDLKYLVGFALGGIIIFTAGIYDDLKNLRPRYKLLSQSLAVLILILFGLRIDVLYIPFFKAVSLGLLSYPVTFAWCLLIINAFNLIDGLDGLAAGISVIASLALLGVGIFLEVKLISFISLGIIGACLGFLRYNYPPAKIFMGDSGSQYLGYVFAAEGVICPIKSYTTLALFIPLLALGLPIFETFFSVFRRTLNNKRFYHADKRHLFHFLLEKGLSQKLTIWIFYIISIILSIITWAILVRENKLVFSFLLAFLGILVLVLAYYLFRIGMTDQVRKE